MQYLVTNSGELLAYDPNDPNQDEFLKKLFKKAKNVVSDGAKLLASTNPILRATGAVKNTGYKTGFGKTFSKVTDVTGSPKTWTKAALLGAGGAALKGSGAFSKIGEKLKTLKIDPKVALGKLKPDVASMIEKALRSASPAVREGAEKLLKAKLAAELNKTSQADQVKTKQPAKQQPLQSSISGLTSNPLFIVIIAGVFLIMVALIFKK